MNRVTILQPFHGGFNIVLDKWYVVAWTDTEEKAKQIAKELISDLNCK